MGYLALRARDPAPRARELVASRVIVPVTRGGARRDRRVHAVFFGAGRYGLVVVPFVTALAFVRPERKRDER